MTIGRQMATEEQRRFWQEVKRSADEVDGWPAWLRGDWGDEADSSDRRDVSPPKQMDEDDSKRVD